MWRKGIALLGLVWLLTGGVLAAPEVSAPSCLLMDRATGTVLYEKNADERLSPASVTKVMTLLLVMEAVDRGELSWDQTLTASETAAAKGGSQVYLEPGEQMPLREMVKCVTVASANDCACALAEAVAGSEAGFVERMNRRAAELGMSGTHFANCTGLDDEAGPEVHYTTARDIAIMSRALLGHDAIRQYTTIWMDTIRDGTFGLTNTNKLIRFYPDATGLKTGFTSGAGYCMAASAEREGMELIAAVMHCDSSSDRFSSAKALLEYGFANYALRDPAAVAELPELPVTMGTRETVPLTLGDSSPLLMARSDAAVLEAEPELPESLPAPVAAGQQVGLLRLKAGGRILAELPVTVAEDVERLKWKNLWGLILREMWMGA